jgi:Ser-tRNA(Ala) deacylase AlaX
MTTRRLYYDDAFLREFDARVMSSEPAVHSDGRRVWEVVLDATAFYPTSGGQPHDIGRLDDAEVLDVRDEGEEIVHVVDRDFEAGEAHGCISWPRRLDHRPMRSLLIREEMLEEMCTAWPKRTWLVFICSGTTLAVARWALQLPAGLPRARASCALPVRFLSGLSLPS